MDLIWLIIIISIISKVMKADKKKKEAAQQARRAADQAFEPIHAPAAKPAAPKPAPAPAQTMMPLRPEPVKPLRTEMQPRVHAHLAPNCEEHDKPGSLQVTSTEGKDACHEGQLPPADMPRPEAAYPQHESSGIQLDWSGENMVKAFVMQEVLTRPCERRRRA